MENTGSGGLGGTDEERKDRMAMVPGTGNTVPFSQNLQYNKNARICDQEYQDIAEVGWVITGAPLLTFAVSIGMALLWGRSSKTMSRYC